LAESSITWFFFWNHTIDEIKINQLDIWPKVNYSSPGYASNSFY